MPVAMPELAATASASSTISSRESTRSPWVSIPTLHLTGTLPTRRNLPPLAATARDTAAQRSSAHANGSLPRLAQLRQERRELLQAAQVVAGQHQVGVLGRDHHPERA